MYFKTELANGSETYTFNLKAIHRINNPDPYYGLFECDGEECIQYIRSNGYIPEQLATLIIEVPDNEPQFKTFDRVLVRKDEDADGEPDTWVISYFMDKSVAGYRVLNGEWFDQCIPYEGNEHLLGTTNKPKEE